MNAKQIFDIVDSTLKSLGFHPSNDYHNKHFYSIDQERPNGDNARITVLVHYEQILLTLDVRHHEPVPERNIPEVSEMATLINEKGIVDLIVISSESNIVVVHLKVIMDARSFNEEEFRRELNTIMEKSQIPYRLIQDQISTGKSPEQVMTNFKH